jgi:stage IV sporulation protein B
MKKIKFRRLSFLILIYTLLISGSAHCYASEINVPTVQGEESDFSSESAETLSDNVQVSSRLWELIFGEKKADAKESRLVAIGGNVFGIKMNTAHPIVADADGNSLFRHGDVILSIGDKETRCNKDVESILDGCGGEVLTLRVLRSGSEMRLCVKPTLDGGKYRLGVSLRDSALGIGTVTYIDPESGSFGGLGHGVTDSETGELVEMQGGDTSGVVLGGVHKGECGKPGELVGILTSEDVGDIYKNTDCGIFGRFSSEKYKNRRLVEVADKESVKAGEARIISTIKNGKEAEYKIEIYDINYSSDGSKSFKIRVTDEALIALSGGIVRGMSGSPIIQDGKLVGAVTHVLVANPREGYGIFIENMLNASESALPKAA